MKETRESTRLTFPLEEVVEGDALLGEGRVAGRVAERVAERVAHADAHTGRVEHAHPSQNHA